MANCNVTLQAHLCKENGSSTQQKSYKSRQLTILEVVREPKLKSNRALFEHHPVQLEPYTVLRGQWLAKAGFSIGQKITIQVSHQQLIITPSEAPPTTL